MTLLSARNISKSFRQPDGQALRVIEDVSITLQPGEIVCLLGASGSGKTTLLQMLAGFDRPDGGTVSSDIARPGAALGYLTQHDALLPWRTALGNITLGPELLGQDKKIATHQARLLLQQTGLEEFAGSYPHQLSGGMKQRLLLARTLATNPRVLLMDEPMSNLDVLARRQMSAVIRDYVRTAQAAALVVTHSVEEACFIADRILLITRSPAVIYREMTDIHLDAVMMALLGALEGKRA